MSYKYIGGQEINLIGYGIVLPDEVIEVLFEINHPLFIKEEKKGKK